MIDDIELPDHEDVNNFMEWFDDANFNFTLEPSLAHKRETIPEYVDHCLGFLSHCFHRRESNSHLVVNTLKFVIRQPRDSTKILDVKVWEEERLFLEFIMKHAKALSYDFGGFINEDCIGSGCPEMLLTCVTEGQVKKLLFFLRYGFPALYSSKSEPDETIISCSEDDSEQILEVAPFLAPDDDDQLCRVTCAVLQRIIKCAETDVSRVRNIVQAFHIFMMAIPDPFIKFQELANFPDYKTLRETYIKYFPQMSQGPKIPRSLMHLSRCTIRKHIHQLNPLDIKKMRYPVHLKKYLNLKF